MDQILTWLSNPYVIAAAGVLLSIFAPKIPASVLTSLSNLLARLKPSATPATPTPAPTVPVPSSDPSPDLLPNRPVLNLGLKLLLQIAQRRFPDLSPDEALERHLVEQVQASYLANDNTSIALKATSTVQN